MTTLVIPAHNEGMNIAGVLSNIPSTFSVLVVDDGSSDNTKDVVKSHGYDLLALERNYGKGHACTEGIKKTKTDRCIFVDADGQLDVREAPDIARALNNADIVIGERSMHDIPLQRKLANRFATRAVNYLTGRHFNDVLCGFRGVRKEAFSRLDMKKLDYFFESEMILEACRKNMKIKAVPVSVDYSRGSRMPAHKSMNIALWLSYLCVKKFLLREK